MSKKKTTMQIAIDEFKISMSGCYNDEDNGFEHGRYIALQCVIERMEQLRDTEEKEQLMDAYESGSQNTISNESYVHLDVSFEQWYNETYGDKKE